MSAAEDWSSVPADFSGRVRLFPVPDLVLFPHVMQPLRVFEPRYRALLKAALATDRLIAMAVLAPGWQKHYEGRPPLYPFACLGRIASHHRLPDGTYNVLLWGLCRVRLLRELCTRRPFRVAEVEVCSDQLPPPASAQQARLHRKLRHAFLRALPELPEAQGQQEQLASLFGDEVPLAVLTDVIGYLLDLPLAEKELLLAEANVCRRAERLLGHLEAAEDRAAKAACVAAFPLRFSIN